ncbi:MAG: permease [Rhodobacter sp. CACIA14H1]|nr:MAG: permease [Rhodobacter sp. CACIA14H1]
MTRLPQGVLAIIPAVFAMALTDAIIKQWSAGISLWQIWVLRSLMVLPVLFVMARGRVRLAGAGWVAARCLALVAMYLTMYPALPLIDMSLAGAAFYTAPLFIAGLSAAVLGNRISGLQWAAILVGFAGLLVIVRPFGLAFTPVILLPVAAAFCYACAAVITRARCMEVAPVVMGFWLNIAFLGFGGLGVGLVGMLPPLGVDFPFLLAPWQPMAALDWAVVGLLACLMLGVSIAVAVAYKSPQPAVIATLEYCYMIFATVWGFVFFGEVPDGWTLLGMVLIAAGGAAVLLVPTGGRPMPAHVPERLRP